MCNRGLEEGSEKQKTLYRYPSGRRVGEKERGGLHSAYILYYTIHIPEKVHLCLNRVLMTGDNQPGREGGRRGEGKPIELVVTVAVNVAGAKEKRNT